MNGPSDVTHIRVSLGPPRTFGTPPSCATAALTRAKLRLAATVLAACTAAHSSSPGPAEKLALHPVPDSLADTCGQPGSNSL